MTQALLLAAWITGQAPVQSSLDDGAVLGRVCVDRDGDGRCGADEPGLEAARVVLDTGLKSSREIGPERRRGSDWETVAPRRDAGRARSRDARCAISGPG
ncbi:MAG: hypothetical protein AB1730_10810, partial [Myxococcota bacterium]